MTKFHKPRISNKAFDEVPYIVREQSDAKHRIKGDIFGFPIYCGKAAPKISEVAKDAQRIGWRYFFISEGEGAGSDAIVDFEKTSQGKPYLSSFMHSDLPRRIVKQLERFEREQKDHRSYYLQLLTVPELSFEMLWFKDAARKKPEDAFSAITLDCCSESLKDEIEKRYMAACEASKDQYVAS